MKKLTTECPICAHLQEEFVDEKTTVVCDECQWPFELYEDGRIAPSALAHVRGDVWYVDLQRVVFGQYGGRRTCNTLSMLTNNPYSDYGSA